jgi:hypothetical protein
MGEFDHSTRIQALLDQRKAGQAEADDALLQYSFERLHVHGPGRQMPQSILVGATWGPSEWGRLKRSE